MTEKEQKLAEENHNLIYDFAKKRNLVVEDYYGLLAIGLCNAATSYSSENENTFSTYAFSCMQNIINDYWRSISLKRSIPEENILSYDASTDSEGEESFAETFADSKSVIDDVIGDMHCEYLLGVLNEQEQTLVHYLLKGLKGREIAVLMNVSERYERQLKKKVQKKLSCYINY